MKRREFLKAAGAAGIGVAASQFNIGGGGSMKTKMPKRAGRSMINYADKPMDKIRLGFIGVGARGPGHVSQMLMMDGVEVKAICDLHQDWAENAAKRVVNAGQPAPALYVGDEYEYRKMLDRDDIDAVIIATPWEWHVPMCVDAMERGKHAFTEVPAAYTIEDCWKLVDTSEKTQRHCMMMENVNYGREELLCLNMCRLGVFGELLHGEAAYIHDLRSQMHSVDRGTGSWRTVHYMNRNGNLYPTHGLGPVAHYMGINRGDRFDYMSSMSCNARMRDAYGDEKFPADHKWNKKDFVCGDMSTSIIKTVGGKTIMVQWDEQLPRPYSRHNYIQGTKGAFTGFPNRCTVEGISKGTGGWDEKDDLQKFFDEFEHPLYKHVGEEAVKAGGHGGMDFIMLWRIAYNLRNGLPMDQDVYDAAAWSAVTPLSEDSLNNRSASMDFPDFTRGEWDKRDPHQIEV